MAVTAVDTRDLLRAVRDPCEFARVLCGAPLWDHQASVARSKARYRVICAGRQVGKSRLLAVLALHQAFSVPGSLTLIVSAGEDAAKRLLAECAALVSAPLLVSSVVEDQSALMILSNGSQIKSVPASQKQIRGNAVNLLIIDESGWVDTEVFRGAEPSVIARPGSRIIAVSSPAGGADHWYRKLWQRGMDSPDVMYESWHWPSTASPMVDEALLEEIRKRETSEYFNREYLAIWTSDQGTFFSGAEIMDSVADYDLISPEAMNLMCPYDSEQGRTLRPFGAAMGLDWAYSQDAQAAVVVAALDDGGLNGRELAYFVPWLEYRYKCPYSAWVDRSAEIAMAYNHAIVASECNGVGAAPTETLRDRLFRQGSSTVVSAVWTDARRKQSGFGKIKMMMQQGRLVIPREPELLRQLRALEFEAMDSGTVRIAVPARAGHDDLAMAMMQAVSCIRPSLRQDEEVPERPGLEHCVTGAGLKVPLNARPVEWHMNSYMVPSGRERTADAAW
jgi:hypothetical protein